MCDVSIINCQIKHIRRVSRGCTYVHQMGMKLTCRTTGYLEPLLQSRQGNDDVNEGHRLDGAQ